MSRLVAELERERDLSRTILHCDMDMFYAAVELQRRPELAGACFAVGHGVLLTASYEARQFGVRSAMPGARARRLCPDLVFVKPRFEVYRGISEQIRAVFAEHTDLIEPVALDEAYLDVTENRQRLPTATAVARAIRASTRAQSGLVGSAGVSAEPAASAESAAPTVIRGSPTIIVSPSAPCSVSTVPA